jgi:tyrosyl-tRNA synthetase
VDLIRRLEGETAFALTFPLITTSSGIKMGKTHKGAVWLDREQTSPYEYYQYWINQDDRDIMRFLAFFTFLPMGEVNRLGALPGEEIKHAKEILAYEATRLCHGPEEADAARAAARQLFGVEGSEYSEGVPTYTISAGELEEGIPAFQLFEKVSLCKTRTEARRLIAQGGGYVNGERLEIFDRVIDKSDLKNDTILLRAGKKRYLRITLA